MKALKKYMTGARKFTTLALTVVLLLAFAGNSQATPIVGLDYGGDYDGGLGNRNSALKVLLQQDLGDFNSDSNTDSREFLPIDTPQYFVQLDIVGYPGLSGKNNKLHVGAQTVNYSTTASPTGVRLFRYAASTDALQMTNEPGTSSMGMAFTPHVKKSEFLNGLDTAGSVGFADDPNGFSMTWGFGTTVQGNGIRRARMLAQEGSDWFISEWTSGSKNSSKVLNPFSETWYPFDPDTNYFYEEVGSGDITPVGTGVLGSTFSDLQSLGVHMMNTDFNGTASDIGNMRITQMSATLVGSSIPGDFNGDNKVDGADFLLWQTDNMVGDLADWEANFGPPAPAIAAASIPEPSTILMGILVSLGLLTTRRR